MNGYPFYFLSHGGLLKMMEITFAAPSLVLPSSLSFNDMSTFLLLTIVNGSDDVPHTGFYLINYAIGTLLLALNSFTFYGRYSSPAASKHVVFPP
ncbi:hypothetical protein MTO96_037757 [Rhipicephalus appendiculatus]